MATSLTESRLRHLLKEIGEHKHMALNTLELLDQQLAKAAEPKPVGGNRKPIFLFFRAGHTALVRPLYGLEQMIVLRKHDKWADDPSGRVSAICAAEEGRACLFCKRAENDKKLLANLNFYLPVYVHRVTDASGAQITYEEKDETGKVVEVKPIQGVRLLELTVYGKIGHILKTLRDFTKQPSRGALTGRDFTISQTGSGTDKAFICLPEDPSQMPERIAKLSLDPAKIRERVIEARAPHIVDEPDRAIEAVVQAVKNGQPAAPASDEDDDVFDF